MIPVFEPIITKADIRSVTSALIKGQISGTFGDALPEFEELCAKYHGVKYAVTTNSCTSALHLTVEALGIKSGDEVIIQAFTNIATCLAVVHAGATPIAADSEPDTWNIDISQIESKITKKTKAIMPVHIYGHPVDMDPLLKLAQKYNLFVIEDVAEAQGSEYKGRKVGCFGTAGCMSFYVNKTITTGEGGMVLTNDKNLADKINLLKNLAFEKPRFLHWYAGYNYCMPNLVAALGLSQLKRIDSIVKTKRQIAHWYLKYLKDIPGLQLPKEESWATSSYWMFGVLIEPALFGRTRDQVMEKMLEHGIETRAFFIPMNVQPVFHKRGFFKNVSCPIAENLGRNGLYFPSGYNLTEAGVMEISNKLISLRRE